MKGVLEHIMEMRNIAAHLKTLEVDISNTFLVHYILNTLPHQYGPFKISYNTHKEKWLINELLTMCVQEEGRLLMEQGESVMLITKVKYHNQGRNQGKNQADKKRKKKYHPKAASRKNPSVSSVKRKDT